MPYFAFKLLFAALALVLLVVLVLIARQLRGKRQSPRPDTASPAASPAASTPNPRVGLGRKPRLEPVPDPAAPPAPRRRQLASFAASEREAAEVDSVTLPSAATESTDEPIGEGVFKPDAEAEHHAVMETPPIETAAPEPPVPEPAEFERAVLGRLELAFEAFQSGEITLDGYRARVMAEEEQADRHIALHQASGDEYELEAAIAARESVRWCLDWADEHESASEG